MTAPRIHRQTIPFPDDLERVILALGDAPFPFLLESGLRRDRLGRYSILGADPFQVMTSCGREIVIRRGDAIERHEGNPFDALREQLARFDLPPQDDAPFFAGAVGYLAYDLGQFVERLPQTTLDDIGLPEMALAFHDTAAVFDHETGEALIVAADLSLPQREKPAARAERLAALIESPPAPKQSEATSSAPCDIACNFTRDEYLRALQRTKDYIASGDIFQANISRRFETALTFSPAGLYARLRRINPAPMAALLQFEEGAVISASPERFLKVTGRHVETRPIKGTRPRGESEEADRRLADELIASEKDNAELAMIVDLERNDLGRVCNYGTVRVTEPRALESYPTVHHLVATVEGDLHPRHDRVDLLKASFPGGSITGAPKIRAMEIIDELEPTRRSVYTGAIGYLGFDGNMDLSIVIRTFIARGGRLFFQAGGGIVADSEPDAEYDETGHKARALIEAVGGAGETATASESH